ncbi:MAG: nitrite/sulfite reductase, partial [Bacteroidota bacterium]
MSSHSSLRPEVQKDIQELRQKIGALHEGQLDEERFKHYRLTRGVYGQRQLGVQMFRIKIPYGRISTDQLDRIGRIARTYTNGNLHLTTRQDIQLHFVKLEDSPAIWTELEELHITAREACGNTVRNVTGSPLAGIDPNEPFDISPYAEATTQFFLRNPICQDMGRKIKIAFSASEADSAFTYFHDFGFIPKIKLIDEVPVRGFKVLVGGGLGAQSMVAKTAYEFLAGDEIIPFMEAAIRVFDRYGERQKRFKARMKFLIKSLGLEEFLALVRMERKANKVQRFPILAETAKRPNLPSPKRTSLSPNPTAFQRWKAANTFGQKQEGYVGVKIRLPLGNILTETVYAFTNLVRQYAADDIRLTVNQGILLRYVRPSDLPALFDGLAAIGLGDPGFDSLADITACPGTDTCALGVTNSTALAARLEEVIREEYPGLVADEAMKIKISGCMNACGQHMAAQIGFHGSSIKKKPLVIPAMQIVLGGGVAPDGRGFIAEKIIKLPTKRVPQALRI